MHADFSVELGHDDPVLEIPWASDDHSVRYYDLKTSPELVLQIPEAAAHPEIRAFLTRMNVPGSPFATAKCDVWESRDITPEEEIFGADQKFVSYIDLIFVDETVRSSFEKHEEFARNLCLLLSRAPDIAATVELVIRRCYYHQQADRQDESDRMSPDGQGEPDRMSKDAHQATTDHQTTTDIPFGQNTSPSQDSEQYTTKQPHRRTDNVEPASRLNASGGLDSEASFKSASPHDQGGSLKSEHPQHLKTPLDLSDPASFSWQSSTGIGDLHATNIFPADPKSFSNESTVPLNERSVVITGSEQSAVINGNEQSAVINGNERTAVMTGFSLTAYVTGFGDGDHDSRPRWAIAVSLLQHALVQVCHI